MNIEQMAAAANKRVAEHINRSAGQHMRAFNKGYACADNRPTDRELIQDIAWAHGASFTDACRWIQEIDFEPFRELV